MNKDLRVLSRKNKFFKTALLSVLFLGLLTNTAIVFGQDPSSEIPKSSKKITGVVSSSVDKSPLEGVTVKIKGKSTAVQTGSDGKFTINATPQDTLVFSYINYTDQSIRVGNKTNIPVLLIETPSAGSEVIVIGYGTVKRKDATGSVGKVNIEDLKKAPVTSFDQALAGRVAGVVVSTNDGQPGGSSQIVIRGSTAGQEISPLYVIDGFPIENMDINSINMNDIENIEVLKDASSIAIYGARGANGVIIITTKKGKAEPTRVTYSVSNGSLNITKKLKMLSPYEFVKLQLEIDSVQSTGTTNVITNQKRYIDESQGIDLDYYKNVKPINWQDLIYRQGTIQTHNLSLIGGNKDNRYAINGGYTEQKGVIINTGLKKYDGKFNFESKYNDKIRYGVTLTYSNTGAYGTQPSSGSGGVVFGAMAFRPVNIIGAGDLETGFVDSSVLGTSTTVVPDNLVNPKQQALNEYRKNITVTTNLNSFIEYSILPDLKLKITGGVSNTKLTAEVFYNSKTSQGNINKNSSGNYYNNNLINGSINNTNNNNYLTETTLSYRKRFDQNNILDAVAGFSYQRGKSFGNGFSSYKIPLALEGFGINSLGAGTNATNWRYGTTQNQLVSFFGRVNYSLKERYLFTATGRNDGSSKFAAGNQWGFFPSAAFAWRFTQESFFKRKKSILTDGKLKISYGLVGNNKVNDFASLYQLALTSNAGYYIDGNYIQGSIPYFYGNKDITWEKTGELNIGTSLSFFKDRILIDIDYYRKETRNSLLNITLPSLAGYANGTNSQYQNAATITNRGLEFSITTTNIQKKNFAWTSSFNISFNKNKIVEFYRGTDIRQIGWNLYQSATAWVAKEGYPISQFFGYKWAGVYQYGDFNQLANGTYVLKPGIATYPNITGQVQPGDPKYADLNGDGVIDDNDRTIIGSALPIHTGGFSNNFSYKSFKLNLFFQWSYGNQVLNANKMVFNQTGNYYANSNQYAEYANRWTPTNPTNDIPRASSRTNGTDIDGNTRVSSRLIEDGSYLRFKTVSFSYNLPAKYINKMKLNSASIFISIQNLYTFTKYSGYDPEVSTYRAANPANLPSGVSGNTLGGVGYIYVQPSSGAAALAQGYDYVPYPRSRTFTVGANITF